MTNKTSISTKKHKTFVGVVASSKNEKTIIVTVETAKVHSLYHRRYKSSKKYHAHDENNLAKTGDVVKIIESRPYSALKRFKLLEIVNPVNQITADTLNKEQK